MKTKNSMRRSSSYLESIPLVYRNIENWPCVDGPTLPDLDMRARLKRLTRAAALYLKGEDFRKILEVAQLGKRQFFDLMDRALSPVKGGSEINGTRAFVTHMVQKPRKRQQPYIDGTKHGGYSGMFGLLLREFVKIEKELIEFLNGKERPNKVTPLILHKKFLKICKESGVPDTDYPFNTKSHGYRPLQLWYQQVYIPNHLMRHVRKQHGRAAVVAAGYELGDGQSRTPPLPYAVWVIDEFKVDLDTVIELPMARWDVEYVELSAYQVLRIRSIGPICCNVAWHMCLRTQAGGTDIIQVFKNAVFGQPPVEIVEESMKYEEGAGFPQNVIPQLKFVVPAVVYLDNALSHLFNPLQTLLQRLYGGRVILGIPGSPKGRPDIESAIARINSALIHQLPSTTGTGPTDPLRKRATVLPHKRVQVGLLEQALDNYLANENVTPSANAGYLDSFTRLQRLVSSGQIKCNYLPETKRRPHHFSQPQPVKVHQDLATGRLPWVNYLHRRYSSSWLKTQPALKKELLAMVDYSDLRTIVLVDETGADFATVRVEGPWSQVPHDLRMLQIYAKHKSDEAFSARPGDQPLFSVLSHLANRAKNDRDAALEYAYIMRYLKRRLPPEEIAQVDLGDRPEWVIIDNAEEYPELAPPANLDRPVQPLLAKPHTLVSSQQPSALPLMRFQVPRRLA